ncbi:PVL orf 52-like protein [Staphylococcus aureus]|uniref:PVL orf 52-like protein n=1 Tax=Staphylococcus aureus TaxID=1280 RepID=A0A380DK50_STAAU|nr:PVL orf 52-like protein [Staphylococcus aureus]
MMKIKVKKTMTLSELIEWAWENPELSNNKKFFARSNYLSGSVKFFPGLSRTITTNNIMFDDEFEVEVEEEITEETKFDRLFEVFEVSEGEYNPTSNRNTSINESLNDDRCFPIKAFYILNDDLTMTLIWKRWGVD